MAVAEGVELALRRSGPDDGAVPVLLVHGLASNARTWDGVVQRLAARGVPVAAVDQRGHGRSDKPVTGYDFATLSRDLVTVVESLGWGARRPLVAGQSWGGNVVLELAIRHPEATRAVACIDGGTIEISHRFPTWEQARAAMTPPRLTRLTAAEMEAMIRAMHPDWPDEGIAGTLDNVEIRADATIAPWLTLDRHLMILGHLWDHHPSARFALVPVPVLLVPTAMVGSDEIELAVQGLPRSRVCPFPGAHHDIHVQHPVALADLLLEATDDSFFA